MNTTETGTDIGANLTVQKDRSGLSWDRISKAVYDRLGAYTPTAETLRTWARGEVNPDRIDPLVVAALADVFGCAVSEISTTAASRLKALDSFRHRVDIDLTDTRDEESPDSPCIPLSSPVDLVLAG